MLRVEFYIIYGVFHAFFKHVFLVVTALLPANKQHNLFYKQRRRIFVVIAFLCDFTVYFLKQSQHRPRVVLIYARFRRNILVFVFKREKQNLRLRRMLLRMGHSRRNIYESPGPIIVTFTAYYRLALPSYVIHKLAARMSVFRLHARCV